MYTQMTWLLEHLQAKNSSRMGRFGLRKAKYATIPCACASIFYQAVSFRTQPGFEATVCRLLSPLALKVKDMATWLLLSSHQPTPRELTLSVYKQTVWAPKIWLCIGSNRLYTPYAAIVNPSDSVMHSLNMASRVDQGMGKRWNSTAIKRMRKRLNGLIIWGVPHSERKWRFAISVGESMIRLWQDSPYTSGLLLHSFWRVTLFSIPSTLGVRASGGGSSSCQTISLDKDDSVL